MRPLIFIHQYFTPELAGSAQQLTDLALGLRERGYSVSVITGQPSYSLNGKLPSRENFKGIEIYRVPKIRLSRNSSTGRILSAVSYFAMAFIGLLGMDRRAFLVIGSDPPFLSLVGWFFRIVRGQQYILIVSDIYPDVAIALGELNPKGWMTQLLEWTNRLSFEKAAKIVVLGEKMAERVQMKLGGESDHKIEVIHNWADGDWISPRPKTENRFCIQHNLLDRLVVLFSGNLGKIYNFTDVLEAAASLKGSSKVEFLFIGNGPLRKNLENQAAARELRNIRFLDYQSVEELPYSLTCADLAILPLREEVTGLCVPGKLYYALAAGLPLLVIASEDSEPVQIVRQYDCGWHIAPGDIQSLTRLLRDLDRNRSSLREKARNARICFETHFTKQRAIRQYEDVLSFV